MTSNHSFCRGLLRSVLLGGMACVFFALFAPLAEACPTCKNGISENSTEQAQIVQGYFWSILFMMSMPFLLLGTFSSCMYISVRKARRQQQTGVDQPQL